MTKPIAIAIVLTCVCAAAATFASAAGQSSANFAIGHDTINTGVADMSSANFKLASSVGDSVATLRITSVNFQLQNGFRAQISIPPAVLNLLSVVSRKFHGATPFNLTIDATQPITGAITVEPRAMGAGHTLVFTFDNPVNSVTAASALDAALNPAGTVSVTPSGNNAVVTLSNVADNVRLTISLTGVNGGTNVAASLGFLIGDVNNTHAVTASDIAGIKALAGQATASTNFRFDLNQSGTIDATDISMVKARSGKVIP